MLSLFSIYSHKKIRFNSSFLHNVSKMFLQVLICNTIVEVDEFGDETSSGCFLFSVFMPYICHFHQTINSFIDVKFTIIQSTIEHLKTASSKTISEYDYLTSFACLWNFLVCPFEFPSSKYSKRSNAQRRMCRFSESHLTL